MAKIPARKLCMLLSATGMGAVLAAVTENTLRRIGPPLVHDQMVDWHALSLGIVAGNANGALSQVAVQARPAVEHSMNAGVSAGFGMAFIAAAIAAALASAATWLLVRATDTPATVQKGSSPMQVATEGVEPATR